MWAPYSRVDELDVESHRGHLQDSGGTSWAPGHRAQAQEDGSGITGATVTDPCIGRLRIKPKGDERTIAC